MGAACEERVAPIFRLPDREVAVEMRFELVDGPNVPAGRTTIRRIDALGVRWRVIVESWPVHGGWGGRLTFAPEAPNSLHEPRTTAQTLFGHSQAEVIHSAYAIEERHLHSLLHAYG